MVEENGDHASAPEPTDDTLGGLNRVDSNASGSARGAGPATCSPRAASPVSDAGSSASVPSDAPPPVPAFDLDDFHLARYAYYYVVEVQAEAGAPEMGKYALIHAACILREWLILSFVIFLPVATL